MYICILIQDYHLVMGLSNFLPCRLNAVFLAEKAGFCSSLTPKKQLLKVLMKLRHAFKHQDLGYRFQVAVTQVSRICHYWIDIMPRELLCLIPWPDREIVCLYLPQCFKPAFARAVCIIVCYPTSNITSCQSSNAFFIQRAQCGEVLLGNRLGTIVYVKALGWKGI